MIAPIAGAKLVEHHEPIMLIGIPQSRVDKFIDKYIGLNFIKKSSSCRCGSC